LQVSGQFRAAHRGADAVAALAERADHVPAEEAGAAIDRDQRVDIGLGDIGLDFHARGLDRVQSREFLPRIQDRQEAV
jgi:hypothetical protein